MLKVLLIVVLSVALRAYIVYVSVDAAVALIGAFVLYNDFLRDVVKEK
jgi:hypothetical protein